MKTSPQSPAPNTDTIHITIPRHESLRHLCFVWILQRGTSVYDSGVVIGDDVGVHEENCTFERLVVFIPDFSTKHLLPTIQRLESLWRVQARSSTFDLSQDISPLSAKSCRPCSILRSLIPSNSRQRLRVCADSALSTPKVSCSRSNFARRADGHRNSRRCLHHLQNFHTRVPSEYGLGTHAVLRVYRDRWRRQCHSPPRLIKSSALRAQPESLAVEGGCTRNGMGGAKGRVSI
ncbi:hypothetical protein BDN71DRAFT_1306593 [Pleurotus eryngii]|uniref:Uncharacterized protein n=1 Tax=Pleurotus eryngii TaxID=5323 RepID=A0A9P5ZQ02_PLEER|nr:hypothetical protein BDN71DRAFT_1306593 [Pleurotus eryngii]